jgi:hypothetical protein
LSWSRLIGELPNSDNAIRVRVVAAITAETVVKNRRRFIWPEYRPMRRTFRLLRHGDEPPRKRRDATMLTL